MTRGCSWGFKVLHKLGYTVLQLWSNHPIFFVGCTAMGEKIMVITIPIYLDGPWYRWPIEIDGLPGIPIKNCDFPWIC